MTTRPIPEDAKLYAMGRAIWCVTPSRPGHVQFDDLANPHFTPFEVVTEARDALLSDTVPVPDRLRPIGNHGPEPVELAAGHWGVAIDGDLVAWGLPDAQAAVFVVE
jgi:hypothetical protein